MNRAWAQRWIKLFDGRTDELMELYAEDIRFEDVNLGVRIDNDKDRLRKFFTLFANRDPAIAVHHFEVFDYEGDTQMGCFQWTWDTEHKSDFFGFPAAGRKTHTRGMTLMKYRDGKIILERSIWDLGAILRQLGVMTAVKVEI